MMDGVWEPCISACVPGQNEQGGVIFRKKRCIKRKLNKIQNHAPLNESDNMEMLQLQKRN